MKGITKADMQKHLNQHLASLRETIKIRKQLIQSGKETPTQEDLEQMQSWEDQVEKFKVGQYYKQCELVERPLVSDSDASRVDIIILKYNVPKIEATCFNLYVNNTDWPHKITWYDSRNQTANFSKLWNHLIHQSTCEYVLISDSDAYVCKSWLSKMMESFVPGFCCYETTTLKELEEKPSVFETKKKIIQPNKVGLVVPVTRWGGAHTLQGMMEYRPGSSPFLTSEQVSGFFFLFKKEMWRDIGGFDERFYLHGQDSEWMDRVVASDWDIVVRPDVFVDHEVSASINQSVKDNDIDLPIDLQWTKLVYGRIRQEKLEGTYEPVKYE